MFKRIKESWDLTRAQNLRAECQSLMEHRNQLMMSNFESETELKKGIEYCLSHFSEEYGHITKVDKNTKKKILKETDKWRQEAYNRNLSMAMGYAMFSIWVESSYLPGNNALIVNEITTKVMKEQMGLELASI